MFLAALALTLALGPLPRLTQLADYPRTVNEPTVSHDLPRREKSWAEKLATNPQDTFAGVLAVFTAVLIGVGIWQGRQMRAQVLEASKQVRRLEETIVEMRESNRVAADALEHARMVTANAERPWVGANIFYLQGEFNVGQTMETEVIFRNFGKAPAVDFTTWSGSGLMTNLGPPRMKPEDQYGPNVLFPAQDVRYPHKLPEPLSTEQFNAIRRGELFFVVAGRLTYKDHLRQEHITEYCGFYEPGTTGFQMVAGFNRAT